MCVNLAASSTMSRDPGALTEDITVLEQKLANVERENFDLKMRLFYKEKDSMKDTSTLENEAERVVSILQDRDSTYDQLRAANEEAYNTISELRSELQLVKASKEGSNSAYENLLQKNQRLASLQLEENLKRERQAAQAIASHDASIIAKLEDDIAALQDTHESDTKLVSECADRVAELLGVIEDKNAKIDELSKALEGANEQIEVLKDKVSRQEIFLIRGEHRDLSPKSHSDASQSSEDQAKSESTECERSNHCDPPPPPPPRRNFAAKSMHSAANSNSPNLKPMRHSPRAQNMSMQHNEDTDDQSDGVPKPAPQLDQPFFARMPANGNTARMHGQGVHDSAAGHNFTLSDLSGTFGSSTPKTKLSFSSSMPNTFPRSPISNPQQSSAFKSDNVSSSLPNLSSKGLNEPIRDSESMKPSGYLSEEAKKLINAEIRIETLASENAALKQNLKSEKESFKKLQETLDRVRSSSEEITLLEAEEIARLEMEVERISEERDKYLASSRNFETQVELLRRRSKDAFANQNGEYSSHTFTPESSPNAGLGYPNDSIDIEPLHHSANFNRNSAMSGNGRAKESTLFEMYRRREVELLDALEGVVKRCHTLEEELKASNK